MLRGLMVSAKVEIAQLPVHSPHTLLEIEVTKVIQYRYFTTII